MVRPLTPDKFQYKLRWLDAVSAWLASERRNIRSSLSWAISNIAPTDADVHDPPPARPGALHRSGAQRIQPLAQPRPRRLLPQVRPATKTFSWWDYRMLAFPRTMACASITSSPRLRWPTPVPLCVIDRNERGNAENRPSDHAPVTATFAGLNHRQVVHVWCPTTGSHMPEFEPPHCAHWRRGRAVCLAGHFTA